MKTRELVDNVVSNQNNENLVNNNRPPSLSDCSQGDGKQGILLCWPYEEHIREVEHGSFTPLVFSTSGGMGKAATTTYNTLLACSVRSGVPHILW